MPYHVRVLSTSDRIIPAGELTSSLKDATLRVEHGTDEQWDQLLLARADGRELAVVERHPVTVGSVGAEEIEEFLDELATATPRSGAEWLKTYLPKVRTIYSLQLLFRADDEEDWAVFGALKEIFWSRLGGIIQADGEGFTNEDGYHILWQFSDDVSGPWWMGLLIEGKWLHFQMELGNGHQRNQFRRGQLPSGVKIAT